MNKFLPRFPLFIIHYSLFILLIVLAGLIIPYWTGVEAEKQLDPFLQPVPFLTPLDHHYERGWWSSEARTTFEIPGLNRFPKPSRFRKPTEDISDALFSPPRFYLVHQVDHGFLPIKPTIIETTLYSTGDSASWAWSSDSMGEDDIKEVKLLQAQTSWRSQENLKSQVIMPPLTLIDKESQTRLDWQGLQGEVYLKQSGEIFQADLQAPQLLLKTETGQMMAQNLLFNVQWQLLDFLENEGKLTVANLQVKTPQLSMIGLEGMTVEGNNQVENDSLSGFLKTMIQQVHIGDEDYGSAYCEVEFQRLHLESLMSIFHLWLENRQQGLLVPPQLDVVTLARLIQMGLTLLNQSPKLSITQLRLDTPAGRLQGTLEITTAPLDANIFFNPAVFFNAFNVQVALRLPDTLLSQLTQTWLNFSVTQEPVKQRIQTWLDQNLLVESEPHVYSTQFQLENGHLQVNGKSLPR